MKNTLELAILCALVLGLVACDKPQNTTKTSNKVSVDPLKPSTLTSVPSLIPKEQSKKTPTPSGIQPAPGVVPSGKPLDVPPSARKGLVIEDFERLPNSITLPGKLQTQGLQFQDKTGLNLFVTSRLETKSTPKGLEDPSVTQTLHMQHWRRDPKTNAWQPVLKMQERITACPFDLVLDLKLDQSWSLSDWDQDGKAEITLAYWAACKSDVSPSTYKVLMIEDGKKFALRGTTKTLDVGGTQTIDPAFKAAPPTFLAWAKNVWDNWLVEIKAP